MPKRGQKKGGRAPKCSAPAPVASPSSLDDEEFTWENFRALLARIDALEKEKAACFTGQGDGGEASGASTTQAGEQRCTCLSLPDLLRTQAGPLLPLRHHSLA